MALSVKQQPDLIGGNVGDSTREGSRAVCRALVRIYVC